MLVSIFYWVTVAVAVLFTLLCLHRVIWLVIPLFGGQKTHRPAEIHKIGVLVSARDEETVLPYLLDSLQKQDYPADMFRVYIVADNCSDGTADVARQYGATVFERHNLRRVGKGYALNYLLGELRRDHSEPPCDAYIVCDADNVLEPNYISAMNKVYCDGYPIVSGMRNSKNFGSGWISAGYSLYFLYQSQFINRPRMRTGKECIVSGTGFLFDRVLMEESGGFQFFTSTEDMEITAKFLLNGTPIGYAEDAVLYDEQPTRFRDMWRQRGSWMRGRLKTLQLYGKELFASLFHKPRLAVLHFLLSLGFLNFFGILLFALAITTAILEYAFHYVDLPAFLSGIIGILTCTYTIYFAMGTYTAFSEWERIQAPPEKKLMAILIYPVFMILDVPLLILAWIGRAKWVKVPHSTARSLHDVKSDPDFLDREEENTSPRGEEEKSFASTGDEEKQ